MVCKECNHEYLGHPISKYCPKHRDIQNRKPKKKEKYIETNRIIKLKTFNPVDKEFKCGLYGCHNMFTIKIYPRQKIYPKYCPEHRTEWRRKFFFQQRRVDGSLRKP
jgi:hypothetical protein